MWRRGLLVTGRGGRGNDLRPVALMSDLGRGDFLSVASEDVALQRWPDGCDVVMISPGCTDPVPLLRECLARRIPSVVVGCPRMDEDGRELLGRLRANGSRVLGPGSQGFFDWERGLALCWSSAVRVPDSPPEERHVSLISQGGAVPFSLYAMAVEAGVRFRRVISLGDPGDGDAELLHCMAETVADPATALLILSVESLCKGRDFLALASRAAQRRLPVVLLRTGTTERFRSRLEERHAEAAWTDETMWNSVAGQYGVELLRDVQQIVDLGKLSGLGAPPAGNRAAVLAVSEGVALLLADQCCEAGLDLPTFSPALQEKIRLRLPHWAHAENPVDLSEAALSEVGLLDGVLTELMESPECDMILVATGSLTAQQGESLARSLGKARRGGKPLACCCLGRWRPLDDMVRRMNIEGVPLFSSPRRMAEAMASLWRIGRRVTPVEELGERSSQPFLAKCPDELSEREAMALVESYGLTTVPHKFCSSVSDVLAASRRLGFPLALKVVSPSFQSKQQARAVALNLRTEEELRNAYGRIMERAARAHAGAVLPGVFAQKMVTDGVECMIGVKRDALFGPVVAVALGGAYYGLMRDISLRVAPVSYDTAMDMIRGLKGYPLISGSWYGRRNDVEALAQQLVALSRLACSEPDIELLDINPVFVRPMGLGAQIADAFAVRRSSSKRR